MADRRRKNVIWQVADEMGGLHTTVNQSVILAVLMDIRDELQRLNALLHCPNFQRVPQKLERIARNTSKKRRRPKLATGGGA